MKWQPIETMPNDRAVDVWIKGDNPDYGRRATNLCVVGGKWYGNGIPETKYGEYASHWMHMPASPDATCKDGLQVDEPVGYLWAGILIRAEETNPIHRLEGLPVYLGEK